MQTPPFEKRDAVVRTKRAWLWFPVLAPLLILAFPRTFASWGVALFLAPFVSLFLFSLWPRMRRTTVRANRTGVWLKDDKLFASRESVQSAHVHVRGERTYVRLERRRGDIEIDVSDEGEGRGLVEALSLDSATCVARFWVNMGLLRTPAALLLFFPALLVLTNLFFWWGGHVWSLPPLVIPLVVWAPYVLLLAVRRHSVSVGADGVRIRSWMGRSRFIPYGNIEIVNASGSDVTIVLSSGKQIKMSKEKGHGRLGNAVDDHLSGLAARIQERLDAFRASESPATSLLARSSRSTRDWLRDLGGATEDHAHYRDAAIP
jgi:hypothetical protein